MALIRTAVPTDPVVTVANVKQHLNVDGGHHDGLIGDLIAAATVKLDGRDGILGRCLMPQSWRLTLAGFPCGGIQLPLPPTLTVASIKFLDPSEVEQTLAAETYRVIAGGLSGAVIVPKQGLIWPLAACAPDAVRVDFTAGYAGDDPDLQPLRQAVRLLVKHWYDHESVETIPEAVEALISIYRFAPL
jgi:uncharacterized phiE125 gp8 family phage protein